MNVNAILFKLDSAAVKARQPDARRILDDAANTLRARIQLAERAKMLRSKLSAIKGTDDQSLARRALTVRELEKFDVDLSQAAKEAERVLGMWA